METRADPPPSDEPPPAAAYPRWIFLQYSGCYCCYDPDYGRTVAHARTSRGRPISVSFVLAAPPAVSRLRLHSAGQLPEGVKICPRAIAAHRDSVLVKIDTWNDCTFDYDDYFLYSAGDAAAADASRPPSLSLLPPCYLTEQTERYIDVNGIALLRQGQDEVLVAALDFRVGKGDHVLDATLCLLRSGDWEWELKRLPVIHDEGKRKEVSCWETNKAIPVSDRFLLWVDHFRGIIYSDLCQESPELRYVSLPVEPRREGSSYLSRSVCATDGGHAVRFVEVFPRCCCGSPGETACAASRYAFTITTWALRMDDMTTWGKVGVVHCDELWSLPGYHGVVPRIRPVYTTVSLDDPDVLYIVVDENKYHKGVDGDLGTWMIEYDSRRMEMRSICCYYDQEFYFSPHTVATEVSQYFSPSRTLARRIETDLEAPARPSKLTFPRVASPQEMLGMLQEVPDLARDDMLKAYAIFASGESQFMFRSLLALPMDTRKDYCLLIGKLSRFDA